MTTTRVKVTGSVTETPGIWHPSFDYRCERLTQFPARGPLHRSRCQRIWASVEDSRLNLQLIIQTFAMEKALSRLSVFDSLPAYLRCRLHAHPERRQRLADHFLLSHRHHRRSRCWKIFPPCA